MDRLREARAHCLTLSARHYENFPTASLLLPARIRPAVAAIYAFARTADDFADELDGTVEGKVALPGPRAGATSMPDAERRLAQLRDWRTRLHEAAVGRAADGDHVFIALADAIERFDLPVDQLDALLDAFEQDVTTPRHASYERVLDYCTRSANPVGRLVLALHDIRDEASLAASDRICTALQLTNFWQDVAVDLAKDRIYLPLADLQAFGVTEDDLFCKRAGDRFHRLLAFEVERTRALFAEGLPLLATTRGRLNLWLRLVHAGGSRILDRIERDGFDTLSRRPKLSLADWLAITGRALLRRRAPRWVEAAATAGGSP